MIQAARRWWAADEGRVSEFVVVLTIGILALAGLTLDGGLALAAKVRATGQAEAAARAGAQAIDLAVYRANGRLQLVPVQAVSAAQSYLAGTGASGSVTVSGNTVTVSITASHTTQLLGLVGISSLPIHGTGSAHPQRGVVTISLGFANSEVVNSGNRSAGGA
ncbi:pilus assembly protein TadG-related protein [Amycolatopsis sp. NPDC059657]|uniref:pilus assembly protein TadG-related protein n=1 Tax=Amycolatopsis sp. NPDC059657 TaxID=3346899 RepID=UPI003673558A